MFSKLKQAATLIKEAAADGLDEVQDKANDVFKTKYNLKSEDVDANNLTFKELQTLLAQHGWELSES